MPTIGDASERQPSLVKGLCLVRTDDETLDGMYERWDGILDLRWGVRFYVAFVEQLQWSCGSICKYVCDHQLYFSNQ